MKKAEPELRYPRQESAGPHREQWIFSQGILDTNDEKMGHLEFPSFLYARKLTIPKQLNPI